MLFLLDTYLEVNWIVLNTASWKKDFVWKERMTKKAKNFVALRENLKPFNNYQQLGKSLYDLLQQVEWHMHITDCFPKVVNEGWGEQKNVQGNGELLEGNKRNQKVAN